MSLFFMAFAQSETGYIQIFAEPGVAVFLNDTLTGVVAPSENSLVIPDVPSGTYTLRFEKPGFLPTEDMISLEAGRVLVYRLQSPTPRVQISEEGEAQGSVLESITGALVIECVPVDCVISIPALGIFDYPKSAARWIAENVLADSYQVEISFNEKVINESIEIEPDATVELVANFLTPSPALSQRVNLPEALPVPDVEVDTLPSFATTLYRPLAVLLENQKDEKLSGLQEASSVFEIPVEGGRTTLMAIYTQGEPTEIGPIASARDYFLEAALRMNATLVHVGGAPSTLGLIASQEIPTIDALEQTNLFSDKPIQGVEKLYSMGEALRESVGFFEREVEGVLYSPGDDELEAESVTVNYGGSAEAETGYLSGFSYLSEVNQYRWQRNGIDMTDVSGNVVVVDAVVIAQVPVVPLGDTEGRLYIPYDAGGEATLYIGGKAVEGRWNPVGGFQFVSVKSDVVDLTPFRTWLMFVSDFAEVDMQ